MIKLALYELVFILMGLMKNVLFGHLATALDFVIVLQGNCCGVVLTTLVREGN